MKAHKDWSNEPKLVQGRWLVSWTHKGKKYSQKIAAHTEASAARHGRQVCHPGAYATIEVTFVPKVTSETVDGPK